MRFVTSYGFNRTGESNLPRNKNKSICEAFILNSIVSLNAFGEWILKDEFRDGIRLLLYLLEKKWRSLYINMDPVF